jgi:hypothetical protein
MFKARVRKRMKNPCVTLHFKVPSTPFVPKLFYGRAPVGNELGRSAVQNTLFALIDGQRKNIPLLI